MTTGTETMIAGMVTLADLSALERTSIREFVASHPWQCRVLDYGCGKQPYRDVIEAAGAEYLPWDTAEGGGGSGGAIGTLDRERRYDAILCTQVVQYVPDVYRLLRDFRDGLLVPGGALVLTYPTTWPEIRDDLRRYTKLGMERLLVAAGFTVERHERRAEVGFADFSLALGYGVVGRA